MNSEQLDFRLLNEFQRDFPLHSQPYRQLARELGVHEQQVLQRLRKLQHAGEISRIGPVFRPNTIGASTLAAMAVPASQLEYVADKLNRYPQVNHNYEREHHWNLWFVVTDSSRQALQETLEHMQQETGFEILVLPLVKSYFIDLGFDLKAGRHRDKQATRQDLQQSVSLPPWSDALIQVAQHGLPLTPRPYLDLARQAGLEESQVIEGFRSLLQAGIIKRLGVVVRHRPLGFSANAMVVWNVPDEQVERAGQLLGSVECVNLCYQRPRVPGRWPYNLFCMIHGRDRDDVLQCVRELAALPGIQQVQHEVLFSTRCFKQRGARYRHG